MADSGMESPAMISFCKVRSLSVQMLRKAIFDEGRVEVKVESCLLVILEEASAGFQKLTITYFPWREANDFILESEDKERDGASLPNSRAWLPTGIEDERKAANKNDKKRYLVFTVTGFGYTKVNRHQCDASHGRRKINTVRGSWNHKRASEEGDAAGCQARKSK